MRSLGSKQRLVLVGGGHSHALLGLNLARSPAQNLDVVMVSDVMQAPYSGMLPGMVAGIYRFEDIHIDLEKLCSRAGIKLIHRRAVSIDPQSRTVKCDDGMLLKFDLLSIDVGSTPSHMSVPGAAEFGVPIKPVPKFLKAWQDICSRPSPKHVVVVGGGAGGCEIALAARDRLGPDAEISILTRGRYLLGDRDSKASRIMREEMQRRRIAIHLASEVQSVEAQMLRCVDGRTQHFTDLLWLTQASAPSWFRDCSLPLTNDGFIQVNNDLQVIGQKGIFAVGDCSTMVHQPRPKAGVYAVRQAPILFQNIQSIILDRPLVDYRPQSNFLSLMKLSGKSALAQKGPYTGHGRLWWMVKDWIDRRFMRLFQTL